MMNRSLLLVGCLLIMTVSRAQSFRMRADVGPVGQSGYHRIVLPPAVVGRLNAGLTDLRLYDGQQREVPYVLTRRQPGQSVQFVEFEVVSRTATPKRATTVVLRNRYRSRLRAITLEVKNADSHKPAQLSGSPDARNWYALVDQVELRPNPAATQTTAGLRIDIPASDYEYYRLVIGDSLSEPLNILRVGYDSTTVKPGAYTAINRVAFVPRDSSDRKTYIRLIPVDSTGPFVAHIDKLQLDIAIAGPFRRSAVVGQFRVRKGRRGRMERYFETIQTATVSSADSNVVYLPGGLNAQDFYVVIDNGDSPPLAIRAVRGFQVTTYLTANLTAGITYQLRFSGEGVAAPVYDLAPFGKNQSANTSSVNVTNIRPVNAPVVDTWGVVPAPWLIWVGLGMVLALLGYFSIRMLREMGG